MSFFLKHRTYLDTIICDTYNNVRGKKTTDQIADCDLKMALLC